MNSFKSVWKVFVLSTLLVLTVACGESKTETEHMNDATAAFNSGKYREALIELKNLLQENPENKDARVLLAGTSLKIGDADSASKELERASRLGATAEEIYALQQRTWLKLGKLEEVKSNYALEKASSVEESLEMKIVYAKALSGLTELDAARKQYEEVANFDGSALWRSEGLNGLALLSRAGGDNDRAMQLAQQALDINPDSVQARITLGQIYTLQREFAKGYENFSKGQELTTISGEERFILVSGEIEAALGSNDVDSAQDAANRLFAQAPEHPVTSYLTARVAYVSGDKDLAYERVQKALSKFPQFMPAQLLQGLLNLERAEYPQAEMFLSNVVAAQPKNIEARKLLAQSYLKLGRAQDAANVIRSGIDLGEGEEELTAVLGRINLSLNNSEDNIEFLESAIEANPDDQENKLTLIAFYIAAGRAEEALALVESEDVESLSEERKAVIKLIASIQAKDRLSATEQAENIITTWPDSPRTHNMIGRWFQSEGMLEKARTTLENSYAKNPDSRELLTSISRLDAQDKKFGQAEARLEEYLKRHPKEVNIWMLLASSFVAQDDPAKARAILDRAIAAAPEAHEPKQVAIRMMLSAKELDRARAESAKLADEHKLVAGAQLIHGRVLFERAEYELALQYLKKAESIQSNSREIIVYKARTEAVLKQFAQAKKSYEALWTLDPGNFEAARSIILLEQRKGNVAAASAKLSELRGLRPDDVRVDLIDADLRAERGNNGAAYGIYKRVYAQRPARDIVLKMARLAQGQGEEPEQILRDWLVENSDDVGVRLMLAQRLQQGGRNSDALVEYEAIASLRPDNGLVMNNLAWLYFESKAAGSRERALELSTRAYEQNPDSAQIADTHGWILLRSGDVAGGLKVLALADSRARVENLSEYRDITYHYAAALNESGDRAGARIRLKEILSDKTPFYSRDEAQQLLDSLQR